MDAGGRATQEQLPRKLYTKAKQEPAYRFYALYDKVYRADILKFAYRLVRANKGSAGVDGMSFAARERESGIDTFLSELAQALKDSTYRPSPVRRVMIPKADGSQRPLGIPTIRDRVAQMAAKLIIEPIFEADFCPNSDGFRPKRSAHDAVDDIEEALHQGYTNVIDADLSKYFDSIPHAKLLAVVAERVVDGALLHLIKLWLNVNASLRGWVGYFHYRNSSQVLGKVRTYAEERLRTHLMKRHKVRNRGIGQGRFPSKELYTRYGLFKVPTTAGWKTAHAVV